MMRKAKFSKALYVIGFVLLGFFILGAAYDCYMYYQGSYRYYSSPLYLYILVRVFTFLLPAVISMALAYVIKSRKIQ
ncbi:MAG: hypothetical protein K0R57_4048 [Paenibacillaceae bacterium]|jgi:hypothetical protein|nr:hypothetical protein [Paenibacillaceae bacterium]